MLSGLCLVSACWSAGPASSCEVTTTTAELCGEDPEHGRRSTQLLTCQVTCDPGYTSCGASDCSTSYLDDARNCGACGSTCDGPCRAGQCADSEWVGWGTGWAVDVAVDERGVAWLTSGELHTRDAAGTHVVTSDTLDATAVALDGDWVYWTTKTTVRRAPRGGGTPQTLASDVSPHGAFMAVGGVAYFADGKRGVVDSNGASYFAKPVEDVFGWRRWAALADRAVLLFGDGVSAHVIDTYGDPPVQRAYSGKLVGGNPRELLVVEGTVARWLAAIPLGGGDPARYSLGPSRDPAAMRVDRAMAAGDRVWLRAGITNGSAWNANEAIVTIDRATQRLSVMSASHSVTQPVSDGTWVYWLSTPGLGATRLERLAP